MNDTKIERFCQLSATRYHDTEPTDEHESEHNFGHKSEWGRAGIAALKELGKLSGTVLIKPHLNRSGSIDRGYVSGFFNNVRGDKTVYVSINDGMSNVLYRTAKHPADYSGGSNNTARITPEGFGRVLLFLNANLNA